MNELPQSSPRNFFGRPHRGGLVFCPLVAVFSGACSHSAVHRGRDWLCVLLILSSLVAYFSRASNKIGGTVTAFVCEIIYQQDKGEEVKRATRSNKNNNKEQEQGREERTSKNSQPA